MAAVLPLPPVGTPYIDPHTKTVAEVWRRYLLSIENAVGNDVAPIDARYWVSTGNAELTNDTNLGALTTGFLKITTAAGIATPSSTATIPAGDLSGTVAVANGGTGLSSYTVGDLLYASGAAALSKLADIATGNALITGGIGAAPSYGKIGLTTHVSGTLAIANGGTNSTTALSGSTLMIANGSAIVQGAAGTTTTVLHGNAAGAPTYAAVSLTADVTGTLVVANGGTGVATLASNGVLYGNGTGVVLVTAQGATNSVLTASAGAPSFSATPTVTSLTTTAAVTVGTILTVNGFGTHSISAGGTGAQLVRIRNTTAGTGNSTEVQFGNDASAAAVSMGVTASTFTATSFFAQDGAWFEAGRVGGYSLAATHASGTLRFYSGGTTEAGRWDASRNLLIGATAAGSSAVRVLALATGTEPGSSPADMVQLYSVDLSAGNATLGLRTETAVVTETVSSDRTLSVRVNGVTLKLCLKS